MGNILTKQNQKTLADFAYSSVLLAFDYDGTLAPITAHPARARIRAGTRRLLSRVALAYPTVVISGRTHADLVHRLGRLPIWHVIGNHGLEPWAQMTDSPRLVKRWVTELRKRLVSYPGVVIEDKKYSVTVHYRHATEKARAHRAIAVIAGALPNARAIEGAQAINVIPRDGPDKGVALQRARRVLACETAIYVGDDGTDEDAFASGPADQLLAIRVGERRDSRARHHLKAQSDVDGLLQALLSFRARPTIASDLKGHGSM